MEIYDISKEFFSTPPYDRDPAPQMNRISSMEDGESYNLSLYSASAHAATHADAPLHFVSEGIDISDVPLSAFVGGCAVVDWNGIMTGAQAERLLTRIKERRILLRGHGNAYLSQSAAFAFSAENMLLVGTDAPSIASPHQELQTHRELLGAGIPVLENLQLDDIAAGTYFLVAAPVKMAGMEASPVRALLIRGISVY